MLPMESHGSPDKPARLPDNTTRRSAKLEGPPGITEAEYEGTRRENAEEAVEVANKANWEGAKPSRSDR